MAKAQNAPKGIKGWLLTVLIVLVLFLLSALAMTAQRASSILQDNATPGVYVSLAFLLPYLALLSYSIYLILRKKEDAVTMFVSSAIIWSLFVIWFFILGQIIYAPELFKAAWIFDVTVVLLNIGVSALITTYLLKSKRVKNTLNRK